MPGQARAAIAAQRRRPQKTPKVFGPDLDSVFSAAITAEQVRLGERLMLDAMAVVRACDPAAGDDR